MKEKHLQLSNGDYYDELVNQLTEYQALLTEIKKLERAQGTLNELFKL